MIGVLALQGAFKEHIAAFAQLGIAAKEIRTPEELKTCDALVIPGGESTAIALIAKRTGMWDALSAWVAAQRPTWGTCAGMVLLADQATGTASGGQSLLGGLDINVHRNYFGSQLASFEAPLRVNELVDKGTASVSDSNAAERSSSERVHSGIFIRAPAVLSTSSNVQVLAWLPKDSLSTNERDDVIVAVRQGPLMATAFHPELSPDRSWHSYFAQLVAESSKTSE